ncbi:ParB/RepB/Spo0J family partition protein, partial [Alistipes onderdonkii]
MQTAKANSKSKQSGKTAVRTPAVSEAVAAQAQDPVAAGSPDMKPAEPQATDIGAVNPVAETSPAEQPAAHPETDVRLLDLNKIVNSTYNPRKNFREDTLLELAESIKQSGVLQPICVRPRDEGFEIVYGERRYWAAAMAGLKFIPALIRELSDAEAEDAAITENL